MIQPESHNRNWSKIIALEKCEGWNDWLIPLLQRKMEAIKAQLLDDITEAETAALRVEYRVLKWVLSQPGEQRTVLERQSAERAKV